MTSFTDVRERFWRESINFMEAKMPLLGLLQTGIATIELTLIFVVVAGTRLVPLSAVSTRLSSIAVAVLLDLVPGFVPGTGLPLLVQCSGYINRLNGNKAFRAIGPVVALGMYFCPFFYHPATSVPYAVTYLLGRTTALVGILGESQLKSAIA